MGHGTRHASRFPTKKVMLAYMSGFLRRNFQRTRIAPEAHVRIARVRPSVRCYTSGGLRIVTSGLLLTCCGEFGVDFRCNGKAVSSPPLDDMVWRRVGSGGVLVDRGLVVFWLRKRPMCTRTSFLEFRFLRENVPESTRVKNRRLWFFLRKGGTTMENRIDKV